MNLSTLIKRFTKKNRMPALRNQVRKDLEHIASANEVEINAFVQQYFQPGWHDCRNVSNDEPVKEMKWLSGHLTPETRADLFCRDFYFVNIERLPGLKRVVRTIFSFGGTRSEDVEESREVSDSVYVMY